MSSSRIREAEGDDRSFVVDEGLEHSTSYVFQVRTVDTEGDEDEGETGVTDWAPTPTSGAVESTDDADPPEKVEDLELVAGDTMITASWEKPIPTTPSPSPATS